MSTELIKKHKDSTVNHCIVTMLVLLAATTSVEAQVYHSALKLALSDISKDGVMAPTEVKAIENDILSIIRVFKKDAFFTKSPIAFSQFVRSFDPETESTCKKAKLIIYDSIVIRGPDQSSFL